ncbi:MAG: GAF domain-containing protein [Alphaproteobacteria bacterium]
MHRVIEFLKEIDRGAGNAPQELLDRILRECRRLTGAEAGTIYRVREADDAQFLKPMSRQNDLIELEPMEFVVAMDETSIAGYVAVTAQAVLIDDAYAIPSGRPLIFNASFDVATGYRTGSVACIALRRSQGEVCAVSSAARSNAPRCSNGSSVRTGSSPASSPLSKRCSTRPKPR